jgi:hypothetical protein
MNKFPVFGFSEIKTNFVAKYSGTYNFPLRHFGCFLEDKWSTLSVQKHLVRHPPVAFYLFRMFNQSLLNLNAALVKGVEERKEENVFCLAL